MIKGVLTFTIEDKSVHFGLNEAITTTVEELVVSGIVMSGPDDKLRPLGVVPTFDVHHFAVLLTHDVEITTRTETGQTRHYHDDVLKWKHFPHYWPFVRGIHRSPVNSSYKGRWRGALMFSAICGWTNGSVNNRDAGDLRRRRAYYDVTVMVGLSGSTLQWRYRTVLPSQITGYSTVYSPVAIKKTLKLRVTGPLWGKSTCDRWP